MPGGRADPADAPEGRRVVGWTETRVDAPIPAGFPDETEYYVAVTVDAPDDPFLTVGRVPTPARLRRWLAVRLGLGARAIPDPYVPAPTAVERVVAARVAAGLDPAAVAERVGAERDLIAAGRFDDDVAARNRSVPVGLCVVRTAAEGFAVAYGWFEEFR
ncbi:MAG: hypothetical protein ABEH47_00130 [Haloferacaceae archaeon]